MNPKLISRHSLVNLCNLARTRWWTGTDHHSLHAHDLAPDADDLLRPARDPESGAWHLGLEWDEPRDVRQVVVRFTGDVLHLALGASRLVRDGADVRRVRHGDVLRSRKLYFADSQRLTFLNGMNMAVFAASLK
jgi:hypothetical protein